VINGVDAQGNVFFFLWVGLFVNNND